MIDRLQIEPEETEVYDLSSFGLDAQFIYQPGRLPELWDAENCWTVVSFDDCSISVMSADLIKTINLNADDFEVLKPVLVKALSQKIIITDIDGESEPVFSDEIE